MNLSFGKMLPFACLLISMNVSATHYPLPPADQALIGELQLRTTGGGENVTTVSQKYDIGYNALANANPQVDMNRGFPRGAALNIPTQHLIPNQPHEGIIVNLPEMRMYYFPSDHSEVITYPIGIGKIGKMIPITSATITKKTIDPTWIPPDDIREFNLSQGIVLPRVMPPGPDNPLGHYAIYMTVPTYLIHSTIYPESIGRRASFGCIRMYQSDIEKLFPSVDSGIPIVIINSPIKVGWQKDHLYVEAHPALEEHQTEYESTLPGLVHMLTTTTKPSTTLIDWQMVSYLTEERDGIPHEVGIRIAKK